jgi:hypothetical protein
VATLILEHACLLYSSSYKPTLSDVLDTAYRQYQASDVDTLIRQSPTLQELSISRSTTFILDHRLQV